MTRAEEERTNCKHACHRSRSPSASRSATGTLAAFSAAATSVPARLHRCALTQTCLSHGCAPFGDGSTAERGYCRGDEPAVENAHAGSVALRRLWAEGWVDARAPRGLQRQAFAVWGDMLQRGCIKVMHLST